MGQGWGDRGQAMSWDEMSNAKMEGVVQIWPLCTFIT